MRLAAAIAFGVAFAPVLLLALVDECRARTLRRRRRAQMRAFQRQAFGPWR